MEKNNVKRIILKKEDILLIRVPNAYFDSRNRETLISLYKKIKERLLPKKNKILVLPDNIDVSVIGKEKIKEHISDIDLWNLWNIDENEL